MKEVFKSVFEFIVAFGLFIIIAPIFLVCYVACAVIVAIFEIMGVIDE